MNPKRRTPNPALTKLGYRTYFETDAFLQLQAPENFPPLDLMVVDDQTFDRLIIAQYGGPTALAEIQRRVRNS